MVKFSLLSLFLGMSVLLGCGEIKGQNPEIYPLWPMGTEEENGLAGKERKDDNGRVTNCCGCRNVCILSGTEGKYEQSNSHMSGRWIYTFGNES